MMIVSLVLTMSFPVSSDSSALQSSDVSKVLSFRIAILEVPFPCLVKSNVLPAKFVSSALNWLLDPSETADFVPSSFCLFAHVKPLAAEISAPEENVLSPWDVFNLQFSETVSNDSFRDSRRRRPPFSLKISGLQRAD